MKRIELLEALFLQGKRMRELQVMYFSLRKAQRTLGGFPSPEAKKVLAESKLAEIEYDRIAGELERWWESADALAAVEEVLRGPEFASPVEFKHYDPVVFITNNNEDDDIRI